MFKSDIIKSKYEDRLARYVTAMRCGTPDRIPVRFLMQEVCGRFCGYSNQQLILDYNLVFESTRKLAEYLGVDSCMLNGVWSTYSVGKGASWKYLAMPGVDIAEESVAQFWEPADEQDVFCRADELAELAADPTSFLIEKWMPRTTTRVKRAGDAIDLAHNVALMSGATAFANYMRDFGPAADALKYGSGIVSANSGMLKAPLDIMGDKFRGYIGVCEDSIERPRELLHACEGLMPHLLANALGGADPERNVPITVWAHRGCVPFISYDTFNNIFWPTMKPIMMEIARQGHQILYYAEGDWSNHYDALSEMPAGSLIIHLDKGDPATAVRAFGGKFAISGGLPYDVLSYGTPDDVRAELKKLFAIVKGDGGYILDATALMMSDIQPENLKTAVDYTLEHGVYSQGHACPATEIEISRIEKQTIPESLRAPGVCIPWETESAGYRHLSGDRDLVRSVWQSTDAAVYSYIWTTLLW